jgi:hypothetical protein
MTAKENRSAAGPPPTQQPVEEKERIERRAAAVNALLELRREQSPVSVEEIAAARRAGRP